jgi:hypothetical protein
MLTTVEANPLNREVFHDGALIGRLLRYSDGWQFIAGSAAIAKAYPDVSPLPTWEQVLIVVRGYCR